MTNQAIENELIEMGFDVCENTKAFIKFMFNGWVITYYYKSQWSTGRGITDGRGWDNLLKQIKPVKQSVLGLTKDNIIKAVREALCEDEMQDNTNYNDIAESVYFKLYPEEYNRLTNKK